MAKLRDNLSLIPSAVEEMLRYESPSQHTARLAPADVQLGNRQIHKRQAVIAVMGAGNRDPERFADMVNPEDNLVPKLAILGLTIDDRVRQVLSGLRFPDGVLVAAQAGSPPYFGEQPRAGDVIHAVNGRRITSIDTLRSELNRLKQGEPLVLQVEREGSLSFLVLETN